MALELRSEATRLRRRQTRLLSRNPLSDAQCRYLQALTGQQNACNNNEALVAIRHLQSMITSVQETNIVNNLRPQFYPQEDNMSRVLRFLGAVGFVIQQDNNASIEKVMRKLSSDVVKGNESRQAGNESELVLALFGALGWMTLLYLPSGGVQPLADKLSIEPKCATSSSRHSISVNYAQRPFVELARAFGPLLPAAVPAFTDHDGEQQQKPTKTKLYISTLNASTLQGLAGMQFIWVDTVAAHLILIPKALRLLQSYYDEDEMPSGFLWPDLAKELLQTYHIIFKDDRRARRIYQRHERRKAAIGSDGITDFYLDEVCGAHLSTSRFKFGGPVRESYHAEGDFPFFCRRLLRIQEYVEGIQPNRFISLWRDRRDLQRWYTLWLVLIVGLVSVVLGTVQAVLAAVQVGIATEALKLQKSCGS
ncbi:hypothetical protein NUW58_g5547 [Xylaria curta]|uniref:Uncharacterized protein n=1 Tax=Xylaria curta TaxID=42375 RepID=A0ACC1P2J5_9PEZI|nr:hypothetical protein NUW58_g5547 [Xylaria curta]